MPRIEDNARDEHFWHAIAQLRTLMQFAVINRRPTQFDTQGACACGMISVSQAIIGDIIPPRERGRYQGYFSSMYAVASVAGPVLGGYMTEYLS